MKIIFALKFSCWSDKRETGRKWFFIFVNFWKMLSGRFFKSFKVFKIPKLECTIYLAEHSASIDWPQYLKENLKISNELKMIPIFEVNFFTFPCLHFNLPTAKYILNFWNFFNFEPLFCGVTRMTRLQFIFKTWSASKWKCKQGDVAV